MAQFKLSNASFHGPRIRLNKPSYDVSKVSVADTSHCKYDLNESFVCWDANGKHHAFTMGTTLRSVQSLKGGNFVRLRADIDRDTAIKLACAELFGMDEKTIDYRCAIDALRDNCKYINVENSPFADFKMAMESPSMTDEEREQYVVDYAAQKKFQYVHVDSIASLALRVWKKHYVYYTPKNVKEQADN